MKGRFTFDTKHVDEGHDAPLPREMWLEVRGEVDDSVKFEDVIKQFGNLALGTLPLISTAANAAIGDADVHLALDISRDRSEHDFFQNFLPEETTTLLQTGRRVDAGATKALVGAIETHDDKERLLRAFVQYRAALSYWRDGHETLAVAHLWMAVEALTKVALRIELARQRLGSDEALSRQWGIEKEALDSHVRRRLIFHGDGELSTKTRRTSDGWEHGYLGLDEIRDMAKSVRDDAASHIRRAIFELAGLDTISQLTLLSDEYAGPVSTMPITKYVYGKFIGDANALAPPGEEYPFLEWRSSIKEVKLAEGGRHHVSFNEKMTVRSADDVVFRGERYEVWGLEPGAEEE